MTYGFRAVLFLFLLPSLVVLKTNRMLSVFRIVPLHTTMAESEEQLNIDDGDIETTPGYKPPAEKSMQDMVNQDAEDESLQKYKASLLGSAVGSETTFCNNFSMTSYIVR